MTGIQNLNVNSFLSGYDGNLSKRIAVFLSCLIFSACSVPNHSKEAQTHAERLTPTNVDHRFNPEHYSSFDDYVSKTRQHLEIYKVFMDSSNAAAELDSATPFSIDPLQLNNNQSCTQTEQPRKGIVLLHGLSDKPIAMKDLAEAFAYRCFLSYSMLLPGHGARPAELLNISRNDWLAAARFGVQELQKHVDEVYVGGFSLGGLVAVKTAMDDPSISGVFAFSPALALHRSILLDQTIWIRHLADWLDKDPPDDPWRFESIPYNALAETQLLSTMVRKELKQTPLKVPAFLAQSPDDAVVDATYNEELFNQYMASEVSRLLSYSGNTQRPIEAGRIRIYPSIIPSQRILSYAHQAVHISPENPHYGRNGSYRVCSNDMNTNQSSIDLCNTIDTPYRGEVFGSAVSRYDKSSINAIARLTYNPQFSELLVEIDEFLTGLDAEIKAAQVHSRTTMIEEAPAHKPGRSRPDGA